jgi:ketosteroid isomerase-like protein
MNRRNAVLAFVLLPVFGVAAAAPKIVPAQAVLLQTDVEWAKQASLGKDVEAILSYWTDDAVVYPPKEAPVVGKAAIRKYVTGSMKAPWFSINWKPAQAVVSASGDFGYTTGTNEITFADANGKVVRSNGRYLTVWRRSGTGPWRCVIDSWNEAPPLPPPPPRPARPPARKKG